MFRALRGTASTAAVGCSTVAVAEEVAGEVAAACAAIAVVRVHSSDSHVEVTVEVVAEATFDSEDSCKGCHLVPPQKSLRRDLVTDRFASGLIEVLFEERIWPGSVR